MDIILNFILVYYIIYRIVFDAGNKSGFVFTKLFESFIIVVS